MDTNLKTSIWRQFGAAIDYLAVTMDACPDHLWHTPLWNDPQHKPELAQFWYRAYHTVFWIDVYLIGTEDGFLPPPPFTLIEQDEDGPIPERPYTKAELQAYLKYNRQRCQTTIETLTDEIAGRQCQFGWGECSFLELLIYNLRHVQEHSGQLNLFLGQNGIETPDYPTQLLS